jgi:hypothetical protein
VTTPVDFISDRLPTAATNKPLRDAWAQEILDALSEAGYAVVKVDEPPPWMEQLDPEFCRAFGLFRPLYQMTREAP